MEPSLISQRVHRHQGEVLRQSPQCVFVSLRNAICPIKNPQSPGHWLVRVEVGVEKVEDLRVPGLVHDPEDHIVEVLWSSH